MTAHDFSIQVVERLTQAGHLAYWAGGCVRDFLRGKEANDYDVATNARPDQVREVFGRRRTLPVGESFGVIIVLGPRGIPPVEVATFRSEGNYVDGRRPEHVEFCTAEEDAQRRDFTINGMFFDPLTDVLHDFVGGKDDLEERIIRAIGDPRARMEEDKLRMLRAVRFASVLDFLLDHETASAIRDMAREVVAVSAERIAQELRKMLQDVHRARAVRLARDLDLWDVILPELQEFTIQQGEPQWDRLVQLLNHLDETSFEVAMAALLRDIPSSNPRQAKPIPERGTQLAICKRLRLSNQETTRICRFGRNRNVFDTAESLSQAELKRLLVQPDFEDLLHLEQTAAEVEGRPDGPFRFVDDYRANTPPDAINPPELLTGRDLIELGHRPGPGFKQLLETIREAQLNGEINTRDEALGYLEEASP